MLLCCLLQGIICLHRSHLLNIDERRINIVLSICTSIINLNFIRLQVEKVVLNHLSIKDIGNLFGIFDNFVKKVVVSGLCLCFLILLQIRRILLVNWLVNQVLWLSRNGNRLKLFTFLTCSHSKVIGWGVQI